MQGEQDIPLICECHDTGHMALFRLQDAYDIKLGTGGVDHTPPDAYLHVILENGTFWWRLKRAIPYIFGHKTDYGAYEEIILSPAHISIFETVLEHLKKIKADYETIRAS
jgi:hypothetical protein